MHGRERAPADLEAPERPPAGITDQQRVRHQHPDVAAGRGVTRDRGRVDERREVAHLRLRGPRPRLRRGAPQPEPLPVGHARAAALLGQLAPPDPGRVADDDVEGPRRRVARRVRAVDRQRELPDRGRVTERDDHVRPRRQHRDRVEVVARDRVQDGLHGLLRHRARGPQRVEPAGEHGQEEGAGPAGGVEHAAARQRRTGLLQAAQARLGEPRRREELAQRTAQAPRQQLLVEVAQHVAARLELAPGHALAQVERVDRLARDLPGDEREVRVHGVQQRLGRRRDPVQRLQLAARVGDAAVDLRPLGGRRVRDELGDRLPRRRVRRPELGRQRVRGAQLHPRQRTVSRR